ncbi:PhaM family polyhydroxyalkanoate granule multifunctional regulatory protein [Paraburkholderia dilworthii]|uniref:PhaM family polyhydroxyalkanoate granule multifunctional regulatory protein n=1 Tax=Paraburkholderia dilworthii TaxID=948106 RepID=UPI0004295CE6|nr:PhaM family polyhydroxyalkanoate granule multifunctional regulatory protein [Paraburkholderia dilworthii]
MTDTPGSTPPFPGFPGFPPAEMLERMWGMMRLSPFGSAFPGGAQPGAGLGPSLSMMSDMMAPLTNVEELDKRITDMRAVEQWLKLNLSMLQSAIQALEVQRATLATLRAFGAFAQQSMGQPAAESPAPAPSPSPTSGWPHPEPAASTESPTAADSSSDEEAAPATPPFDASAWWNLLQSQFNQIAQFAMTQPTAGAAGADASGGAQADATQDPADEASEAVGGATDVPRPSPADEAAAGFAKSAEPAGSARTAAKRPAAKRAPSTTRHPATSTASGGSKPPKKSL